MAEEPVGTQYGGFWIRLLALAVDLSLLFLLSAAVLAGMASATDDLMPVAFTLLAAAPLYWPLMHVSPLGATLGKAIIGLRVTRFDGARISLPRSLWRETAKILSLGTAMLGYAISAVLPRKQTLHDLLAATYVVREGPLRLIPALALVAAGFAGPLLGGPRVLDAAVVSKIGRVADEAATKAGGLLAEIRTKGAEAPFLSGLRPATSPRP